MFCGKCGTQMRESSKFCGNCGWSSDSREQTNQSSQQNQGTYTNARGSQFYAAGQYCCGGMKQPQKKAGRIILIVVGILVALFIFFIAIAMIASGSEVGAVVKDGHFHDYPNETVGDAFANFFGEPKWEDFTGTNGNTYVQFTGDCVLYNEIVDIKLVFLVDEEANTFEVELARLDGQLCSLSDIEEILAVVYDE